jgi:hypothetical protein
MVLAARDPVNIKLNLHSITPLPLNVREPERFVLLYARPGFKGLENLSERKYQRHS